MAMRQKCYLLFTISFNIFVYALEAQFLLKPKYFFYSDTSTSYRLVKQQLYVSIQWI